MAGEFLELSEMCDENFPFRPDCYKYLRESYPVQSTARRWKRMIIPVLMMSGIAGIERGIGTLNWYRDEVSKSIYS